MSKLLNQWIDLFRAGTYGDKGEFTSQDVQQVVDNYNPSDHEAPSTVGHKTSGAPAYGWWSKLRRVGDLLQGQMSQVQPQFAEAVESGQFKKRSVGLVKGPKGWMLHHVAWLGAEIPHVKGLKDVAFEQEDSALEIEFAEEQDMAGLNEQQEQSLIDKLTAKFKEIFPAHKPAEGAVAFTQEQQAAAIKTAVDAALKPTQDALDEQKRLFAEGQSAAQAAASKTRAKSAIDSLKASGKYIPAYDKLGVPHLFEELAAIQTTVEFGEEGKKVKQTPLEIMVSFFEAQAKIVPVERVAGAAAPIAATTTRTFAEGTDQNSIKFNELAEALEASEKITFAEAGRRVAREHPELLKPGATAGTV